MHMFEILNICLFDAYKYKDKKKRPNLKINNEFRVQECMSLISKHLD